MFIHVSIRVAINGNLGGWVPPDLEIKVGRFGKKLAGWGKSWQVCKNSWQVGKKVGRLGKKLPGWGKSWQVTNFEI